VRDQVTSKPKRAWALASKEATLAAATIGDEPTGYRTADTLFLAVPVGVAGPNWTVPDWGETDPPPPRDDSPPGVAALPAAAAPPAGVPAAGNGSPATFFMNAELGCEVTSLVNELPSLRFVHPATPRSIARRFGSFFMDGA